MKIDDMIKRLNALKKIHGNVKVTIIGCVTSQPEIIQSVIPVYPLGSDGLYDTSQSAWAVQFNTYKV